MALADIPLKCEADGFVGSVADDGSVDNRQQHNVEPCLEEPVLEGLVDATTQTPDLFRSDQVVMHSLSSSASGGRNVGMADEIDGKHQEREAKTVIRTGLGRDDLAQRAGNILVSKGSLGDGLGEDRVSAGDAGSNDEAGE